ncbi:MAG TPA: hypothetical protein VK964_07095 [Nocardioidaceae bacterium]|nr:hypothetical protein [Nocardioidaceae bacterium]
MQQPDQNAGEPAGTPADEPRSPSGGVVAGVLAWRWLEVRRGRRESIFGTLLDRSTSARSTGRRGPRSGRSPD